MTKEELEKEAKEYADWFWGASPSIMKALANAYIKGAEPREKRIIELEKEYASLKGLRKYELNVAKLEIEKLEKENAELKEIIKDLLLMAKVEHLEERYESVEKAEQFLKEISE